MAIKTKHASTMPGGLLQGGLASLLVTLVGSGLLAKMVDAGILAENAIGYGVIGILLAGAFLGAERAYHKIRRRRSAVCMLSGVVYYMILLAITALFFGGRYTAMGVTAGVVMAGSAAAILPGMGKGSGKRRRSYPKVRRKIVQSAYR